MQYRCKLQLLLYDNPKVATHMLYNAAGRPVCAGNARNPPVRTRSEVKCQQYCVVHA